MAIMQNGKEIVDLKINGRQVESAKVNNRYVYPDEFKWGIDDFVIEYKAEIGHEYYHPEVQFWTTYFTLYAFEHSDLTVVMSNGDRITYPASDGSTTIRWSVILSNDITKDYSNYRGQAKIIGTAKCFGSSEYKIPSTPPTNTSELYNYRYGNFDDFSWTGLITNIINFGKFGTEEVSFFGMENLERIDGAFNECHRHIKRFNIRLYKESLYIDRWTPRLEREGRYTIPYESLIWFGLFAGCKLLNYVNPTLLYVCEDLDNASYLFFGCENLINIDKDFFKYNNKITMFERTFEKCSKMESFHPEWFDNKSNLYNIYGCFMDCNSMKYTSQIMDLFRDCTIENAYRAFQNSFKENTAMPSLTLNFSNFIYTRAYNVFEGTNIVNIERLNIKIGNQVKDSYSTYDERYPKYMFKNAKLNQIGDIYIYGVGDNPNVNLSGMFIGCVDLKTVGNIVCSNNVVSLDLYNMFGGCTTLGHVGDIYAPMSNVYLEYTFNGLINLKTVGLITANEASCTATFANSPLITSLVFEGVVRWGVTALYNCGVNTVICDKSDVPTFSLGSTPLQVFMLNKTVYLLKENENSAFNIQYYCINLSADPKYVGSVYCGKYGKNLTEPLIRMGLGFGWSVAQYYGTGGWWGNGDLYYGYRIDPDGSLQSGW